MIDKYEYNELYCSNIIEHCKQGGFIETLPAALGIPFSVLTNWSKSIQEVDDAISIALSHTINYYLSQLNLEMQSTEINPIKINIYKSLIDRCFKLYDDKINANKLGNENRSGININKNAGLLNLE